MGPGPGQGVRRGTHMTENYAGAELSDSELGEALEESSKPPEEAALMLPGASG